MDFQLNGGRQHITIHGVTGRDWLVWRLFPRSFSTRFFARRLLSRLWRVKDPAQVVPGQFTFTVPGGLTYEITDLKGSVRIWKPISAGI